MSYSQGAAELSLSAEQREFRDAVRDAAKNYVEPYASEVDIKDRWVPQYREMISKLQLIGLPIPEKFGGAGADIVTQCLVAEEMFRASSAMGMMVCASWASANTLVSRPSAAAARRLERLARESNLAAYCMTEPGAGSDAGAARTVARRDADGYVINGVKCFITNGGDADVYSVLATTSPGTGSRGTSMFIIDASNGGLAATRFDEKMGTRGSRLAEITLTDVRVKVEDRLGEEGEGLRIAMESQNVSRLYIAAGCVGIATAALEVACKYAVDRTQFGQSITKFQLVQAMAADMATELAAARALTYDCARALDAYSDRASGSRSIRRQAAMAKLFASNMVMRVTEQAVQMMGGYGYLRPYAAERYMRDAKVFQIFAGTNQIQQLDIGRSVFKEFSG